MRESEKRDDRPGAVRGHEPAATAGVGPSAEPQRHGTVGEGDRRRPARTRDDRDQVDGLVPRPGQRAEPRQRSDGTRAAPAVPDRFDVDLLAPGPAARSSADATSRDRRARALDSRADALSSAAMVQRGLARDDDARAARLRQDADTTDRRADAFETRDPEDLGDVGPTTSGRAVADDAREAAHAAYDSGARRDAWAADLERRGVDRELAAARVRADVSQARPATHVPGIPRRTTARGRGAAVARTRTTSRPARPR